ncbi:hypothetical protein [uncultured Psychrosphaera sp.]|uniref:hypothetical protein n=1 Tax=uncultured Psychrosphaera sp. TaxID=1403522 RepID=UPI0026048F3B|nr:hypothetical protein [uncultured Psychrosphaera sp.]
MKHLNIGLLLLTSIVLLSGCVSFPSQMKILKTSVEIIDYRDIDYFKVGVNRESISAPTIEIKFIGSAPFAYMKSNGYIQQMRCYVYKSETKYYDNNGFTQVYFDRMITPRDPEQSYDKQHGDEKLQYVSYAYRGLTADKTISGGEDIDLTKSNYHHIECGLWGVTILGPHVRSNVIKISKLELIELYHQYLASPPNNNVKKLNLWISENKKH